MTMSRINTVPWNERHDADSKVPLDILDLSCCMPCKDFSNSVLPNTCHSWPFRIDIPTSKSCKNKTPKMIYRMIPGSNFHFISYIFISYSFHFIKEKKVLSSYLHFNSIHFIKRHEHPLMLGWRYKRISSSSSPCLNHVRWIYCGIITGFADTYRTTSQCQTVVFWWNTFLNLARFSFNTPIYANVLL